MSAAVAGNQSCSPGSDNDENNCKRLAISLDDKFDQPNWEADTKDEDSEALRILYNVKKNSVDPIIISTPKLFFYITVQVQTFVMSDFIKRFFLRCPTTSATMIMTSRSTC